MFDGALFPRAPAACCLVGGPVGKRLAVPGQTRCFPCMSGRFSEVAVASAQIASFGTSSSAGSANCTPCDEETQKYCKGHYHLNAYWQLCPLQLCIDRPLDINGDRCPVHCRPHCREGQSARAPSGTDYIECPLPKKCE